MKNLSITLDKVIISYVENLLTQKSEPDKILEIIVTMTNKENYVVLIKVVAWRPDERTMIAWSYEHYESNFRHDEFQVTANDVSDWKSNGFNFFRNIMTNPLEIDPPRVKVIKVRDAFTYDNEKKFQFKIKK